MKKLSRGMVQGIAIAVIAIVITLSIGIIIFGYFQQTASDVVADLNNTDASNAFNTATSITWTAFTLLGVGILALVGFGIVRIFAG